MNTANGADLAARIDAMEQRLRDLEDQAAICELIGTYGPAVDSGSVLVSTGLWQAGGVYVVDGRRLEGHEQIASVVLTDPHQTWMQHGCAHVHSQPRVSIDGDTAVATCYTQLFVYEADSRRYEIRRVSANRWELAREGSHWKVVHRTIRQLNGSEPARQLLAESLGQASPDSSV